MRRLGEDRAHRHLENLRVAAAGSDSLECRPDSSNSFRTMGKSQYAVSLNLSRAVGLLHIISENCSSVMSKLPARKSMDMPSLLTLVLRPATPAQRRVGLRSLSTCCERTPQEQVFYGEEPAAVAKHPAVVMNEPHTVFPEEQILRTYGAAGGVATGAPPQAVKDG